MELDLDPDLAGALATEADERGFESPAAYARWLLENRDAVVEPPGERLEARLDRVEGQLQRLRRTLEDGFETEITVESGTDVSDSPDAGAWFDERADEGANDPIGESGTEDTTDDAGVSAFAYSDDLEPPGGDEPPTDETEPPIDEEPEDAADDDEIAEALADVELEDDADEASRDDADEESTDDGSADDADDESADDADDGIADDADDESADDADEASRDDESADDADEESTDDADDESADAA